LIAVTPNGFRPMVKHAAAPHASKSAAKFYADVLRVARRTRIPFLVGGTCAVNAYIGLNRDTKDLDIFCKPGDYPRLLRAAADAGFKTAVEDERWIAKILRGKHFCDVVFGSANMVAPVTADWFRERHTANVLGVRVRLLPPTEIIWGKAFIQDRVRYDGNDVVHMILVKHQSIDWKRMLRYMDQHWEVLLMHLLNFRYIYPSERGLIPQRLLDELLTRLRAQRDLPRARKKACRGRIFSRDDFLIDITEWGFADLVGDDQYSGSEQVSPRRHGGTERTRNGNHR
jgi:hypothetical protein